MFLCDCVSGESKRPGQCHNTMILLWSEKTLTLSTIRSIMMRKRTWLHMKDVLRKNKAKRKQISFHVKVEKSKAMWGPFKLFQYPCLCNANGLQVCALSLMCQVQVFRYSQSALHCIWWAPSVKSIVRIYAIALKCKVGQVCKLGKECGFNLTEKDIVTSMHFVRRSVCQRRKNK